MVDINLLCTYADGKKCVSVQVRSYELRLPYKKKNSVAVVRERTIPTERPPPVGEVSANFCG
jgi:hypothetical protein